MTQSQAQAIVYSSTNCPYCAQLKEYLTAQNIAYEERNIDTNEAYAQELQSMGMMSLPVTVIGGKQILGLNPTRIRKAFNEAFSKKDNPV